ncbi:4Fe-4S dicluster domain-containing protein [soil metagenome]
MDRVLGWLFKQVEVAPEYHVGRCLAAKGTGCTACADACPHDAITIGRRVAIDPIDCTGCGICVGVCPSGALEARGAAPVASRLRCSQVAGTVSTVICLARLSPTDMLRAAADDPDGDLLLARGDCASCPIGEPEVPARVEAAAARAAVLADTVGRPFSLRLEERDRLDADAKERELSRRELFRGSGERARRTAATALAPLERLAGDDEEASEVAAPLPIEWRDTMQALAAAELEPDALVPARLPRIEPGCILCPSCTRVCPTDALKRVFDPSGGVVLQLDPGRCVGCDACMEVCPVDVVRMDDEVSWAELSGGRVTVAELTPKEPPPGSVTR